MSRSLLQEQSDFWGVFCALVLADDLSSAMYLACYAAWYVLGREREVT